ncbi:flagellar biosynthesis regulator FlhF [Fictibacillus macauensis ZFHKF-1]|uniref:Flagellar biosynthesis regulator FlhF n=1 Tax=Fictibacillus macauensis ZFHKF-1 TaxID=1196324 RepID=I8UDW3_9BACL|nr:flagellar biosynthesis regulator FlhF [Fictibacillus macauensis]EIT85100.1 flagellar biosynthesis regulator FlhF [Fictibacillus macauensis ZFHKF-1]
MNIKKYRATTIQQALEAIASKEGNEAVILFNRDVYDGGFLGFFTKKQVEVTVLVDDDHEAATVNEKQWNDYKEWLVRLEESGLAQSLCCEIERVLLPYVRGDSSHSIEHLLFQWFLEQLDHQVRSFQAKTRFLFFSGPSGGGKTTCIAKIAAHEVLTKGTNVALITTDTRRAGAIQQLKVYSDALHIPFQVAYSEDFLQKALQRFASYDLVLVDQHSEQAVLFPNETFNMSDDVVVESANILVVPMTSNYKDVKQVLKAYQGRQPLQMVITKVDETVSLGLLLNLMILHKLPVMYMTNGHSIPEDLFVPSHTSIVSLYLQQCKQQPPSMKRNT